jgi:hypothetical protein
LKYVDLSYRDLVYLGFDDNFSIEKENIWKRILLLA